MTRPSDTRRPLDGPEIGQASGLGRADEGLDGAERRATARAATDVRIGSSCPTRTSTPLRPGLSGPCGRGKTQRGRSGKRLTRSRAGTIGASLPEMDAAIKETICDLTQDEALSLCRCLWREPVWDLKIVAGRIPARKMIEPDAKVWAFVTQSLADLDGWAVADNLATAASRCLIADRGRLDSVEAWIESPHLWTRRAALVFTLPWAKAERYSGTDADLGCATVRRAGVVHSKGGRLVASRAIEARPRTRPAVSGRPRAEADQCRQTRGDEIFEQVRPAASPPCVKLPLMKHPAVPSGRAGAMGRFWEETWKRDGSKARNGEDSDLLGRRSGTGPLGDFLTCSMKRRESRR